MRKLDFLIAGVQKGGTTALWHFLKQHPQIRFGPRKEIHFFDDESLDWTDPDYEILHRQYADAPEDSILGDATPIYTYWPPSLMRIHAYNPNIRLIVLLRDPISRAFSHWRMETGRGNETLGFSEAIRSGRARITCEVGGVPCHRIFSYLERGLFAQQLDRLYGSFAKDRILVVKSEDLKLDQQSKLDELTDFLNVRRFSSYPQDETVFKTETGEQTKITPEDEDYLRSYYRQDNALLEANYSISFPIVLERL